MIDHLKSMAVFAVVVEETSFRRAANRLSLSPSVISHHVSTLEKRLGVSLIYRSTRSFSLTDEGRRFYESARAMSAAASDGLGEFVQKSDAKLTQLRVAIPEMLSSNPIFDRMTAFAEQNPGAQLVLTSSDTMTNLISETMDVAIRVGRLKDSELKARKISEDQLLLVASPAYAKAHKKPSHPNDLMPWRRIIFSAVPTEIPLKKGKETAQLECTTISAVADSIHVIHKMARAGLGLAGLPHELIREDLKSGTLRRILPDWKGPSLDVFVVWHKNVSPRSTTRAFINHMTGA